MNKICSNCGREFNITARFCPSCGRRNEASAPIPVQPVQGQPIQIQAIQQSVTPQTVSVQPVQQSAAPQTVSVQPIQQSAAPQPVSVQPVQQSAAPQTVSVQPVQQSAAPQPVSVQPVQQSAAPQPAMYGNQQTYIDSSMYNMSAPIKPKKNQTWIIIVSVVGGLLLLLIILVIIFVCLMLTNGSGSSNRSLQEIQDYYYDDYTGADFNSEAFISSDTTAASTEETSSVTVESPDFSARDLTICRIDNQEALSLTLNTSYLLQAETSDLQASITAGTVSDYTNNISGDSVHYSLGRGIAPGASLADFCNAYGINSSNSMLQLQNGDAWNYYYFSSPGTLANVTADTIQLTIGWSKQEDTWSRITANNLQAYFTSQPAGDNEILLYTVTLKLPEASETISYDTITLSDIRIHYSSVYPISYQTSPPQVESDNP